MLSNSKKRVGEERREKGKGMHLISSFPRYILTTKLAQMGK